MALGWTSITETWQVPGCFLQPTSTWKASLRAAFHAFFFFYTLQRGKRPTLAWVGGLEVPQLRLVQLKCIISLKGLWNASLGSYKNLKWAANSHYHAKYSGLCCCLVLLLKSVYVCVTGTFYEDLIVRLITKGDILAVLWCENPHKYGSWHFRPCHLHSRTRQKDGQILLLNFLRVSYAELQSSVIWKRGSVARIPSHTGNVSQETCLPHYRATDMIPGHICLCKIIYWWKNRDLTTKHSGGMGGNKS